MIFYPYTSYCNTAEGGSARSAALARRFAARYPGLSPGAASAFNRLIMLKKSDIVGGRPLDCARASLRDPAPPCRPATARAVLAYARKNLSADQVDEALRAHPLIKYGGGTAPSIDLLLRIAQIDLSLTGDPESPQGGLGAAPLAAFVCGFVTSFEMFELFDPEDGLDFLGLWGLARAQSGAGLRVQFGSYRCLQDACFMELVHCGYHRYVRGMLPAWMTAADEGGRDAPRDATLADVTFALDACRATSAPRQGAAARQPERSDADCALAEALLADITGVLETHEPNKCRREFVVSNLRRVVHRVCREHAGAPNQRALVNALRHALEIACGWTGVDSDAVRRPADDAPAPDDDERKELSIEEISRALHAMDAEGAIEPGYDE